MDETDTPLNVLHKLLASVERIISMDSQSIDEYKPNMLQLKEWVSTLQQQAAQLSTSQNTRPSSDKLAPAEEQELAALKLEKQTLLKDIDSHDAQLLQLLHQLRRLQFSLDGMDPSVLQRPKTLK